MPGPEARTVHVTDNIEDLAVIEATSSNKGKFKLNIFDGQSAKDYEEKLRGNDPKLETLKKLKELTVSQKEKETEKS